MNKKIKDPIYGYINMEKPYLQVIDSLYFQRLRNIIQTSYTSVYPSALHNRFTHSLGVYWLGTLAFDALINNSATIVEGLDKGDINEVRQTFILACLCHDLGHSPFSHTGEKFYNLKEINAQLSEEIDDLIYDKDLKSRQEIVGKEHEIMSALLSIKKFGELIGHSNYSLFARCITGLQYSNTSDLPEKERKLYPLYRSCIELLNSSIIDVDKLDYLIRDSYMSGYSSMSIDYKRLLDGVFINDGAHPIGYKKSSLSILESVLTAHDMERRWIQSHPIVQYESFLLKTIMREIGQKYNTKDSKLLSLPALTEEGVSLNDIGTIRLLSDAEILFLAKRNYSNSDAVKEYCNRNLRRHPIWKSEAEFKLLFDFSRCRTFIETIKTWEQKISEGLYGVYSLNNDFLTAVEKDKAKTEELIKIEEDPSNLKTLETKRSKLDTELQLLNEIKKYFTNHGIPFDIVIISQKQYRSNIYKSSFKELPIRFDNISNIIKPMEEMSQIPWNMEKEDTFFYMYYRYPDDSENRIDVEDFSKALSRMAII